MAESETEEDKISAWGTEEGRKTLTVSPWGRQKIVVGAVQGGARAVRSDTGKSPSAAADEEGVRGRHGEWKAQGEKKGGWLDNTGSKTSGVWVNDGGRKASPVAHESPRVGNKEGGTRPPEWWKSLGGKRNGVGRGVDSEQGTDTPGVAEEPRGGGNPRDPTATEVGPR